MKYTCYLSADAWDLMWTYVELMPGEVGCFGYVELDVEHKEFYVPELFLVPQEADESQVDFTTTGLPYAVEKAIEDDRLNDLRFCVHSHGAHGAFWSSTDEDMIQKMGTGGTPWFLSAIFNRKRETTCRLDIFEIEPFGRGQVTIKDIPIHKEHDEQFLEDCIEDLERFVKKPPPKTQGWTSQAWAKKEVTPASVKETAYDIVKEIRLMDPELVYTRYLETLTPGEVLDVHTDLALVYDWQWVEFDGTRYYFNQAGQLEIPVEDLIVVNAAVTEEIHV